MSRASNADLLLGTHGSTGTRFSVDAREVMRTLGNVQMSNVIEKKGLRKVVRREVMGARRKVVQAAAGAMMSDPRKAKNAVLGTVYKRVVGGSVSLFDRKKAVKKMNVVRKKRGGASGIIRNRHKSARTKQIEAYPAENRGFILRFINKGTSVRTANGKGGRGNRGRISARPFFEGTATMAMKAASENMRKEIEKMVQELANGR